MYMGENSVFYRDLAYIFVAALLGGLLARKLRQPLILEAMSTPEAHRAARA
jgi:hypothetical protein